MKKRATRISNGAPGGRLVLTANSLAMTAAPGASRSRVASVDAAGIASMGSRLELPGRRLSLRPPVARCIGIVATDRRERVRRARRRGRLHGDS